jgi:hypothetical protein
MSSTSLEEKEARIRAGESYSEFITDEKEVSEKTIQIFKQLLAEKKREMAGYVATVAEQIVNRYENPILVSLARAGTPVGILVRRYIQFKYKKNVPHYSISIIRGKGIDANALKYIVQQHGVENSHNIVFVDGWTGKGSITFELQKSVSKFNAEHNTKISDTLAVLADPAKRSSLCGTKKDICIPNACLNSTVSGLISRTILNDNFIGENDFHGAKLFNHLRHQDFSEYFVDEVSHEFEFVSASMSDSSMDYDYVEGCLTRIFNDFNLVDKNKIKFSIGEASRALLRRTPEVMLIKNENNPDLAFLLNLAKEKGVPVKIYDLADYECAVIIK